MHIDYVSDRPQFVQDSQRASSFDAGFDSKQKDKGGTGQQPEVTTATVIPTEDHNIEADLFEETEL